MKGNELNKVLNIGARHALYREDGKWYHHLKKFPGVLFDKNGYLVVNSESEYLNNIHFQHRVDLHVNKGISNLKGYEPFSGDQKRQIILSTRSDFDEETLRVIRQIEVIARNRKLVSKIKEKYNNTCQICKIQLEIVEGLCYSEVHHIRPLGKPHNGPDKLENMICVCPNHHVLLDMGAIELRLENLKLKNHKISQEYISYHNDVLCQKSIRK